jgi:hypothetical protein
MKERKETAAESAARLLNQLTAAERKELQEWKSPSLQKKSLAKKSEHLSGSTGGRLQRGTGIIINEKGTSVSYSASNVSHAYASVPPLVISKQLKGFLITVAALAVISLIVIFYVTLKTFKGHQYPVKSIEQRYYRFR